ncbi:MAG: BT_2262 family domain-containing protein [Rikenellaceae bacterium]
MKRNIILALVSVVTALGLTGCTKVTSEGHTGITYYAAYSIYGDNPCEHAVGDEYVDAGFSATIYDVASGEFIDITDEIEVDNTVDGENMGIYSVTYSHTNVDGFTYSESRTVYVYDMDYDGYDISGVYTTQPGSTISFGGDTPSAYEGYEVTIEAPLPGFFYISDYLAGLYDVYAGYGSNYAMTGYATMIGDEFVALSSRVPAWGDSMDWLENGVYDATNKTITYDLAYYDEYYVFHLVLKLNEEE